MSASDLRFFFAFGLVEESDDEDGGGGTGEVTTLSLLDDFCLSIAVSVTSVASVGDGFKRSRS